MRNGLGESVDPTICGREDSLRVQDMYCDEFESTNRQVDTNEDKMCTIVTTDKTVGPQLFTQSWPIATY